MRFKYIKSAIIKQSDKTTRSPYQQQVSKTRLCQRKNEMVSLYTYEIAKYVIIKLLHFWSREIQGQEDL